MNSSYKRSNSAKILQNTAQNQPVATTVNCQQKRLTCNQIGHYELAVKYLRQCGWRELDGNNDGIPCNKLYRQSQNK